jgi:hypothetical protein
MTAATEDGEIVGFASFWDYPQTDDLDPAQYGVANPRRFSIS